jgi:hypothetical protein
MPGGILRIGVPDLEKIVRLYLDTLSGAREGRPGAADDYDWILLELFDQIVRETSGGRMLEYLKQNPLPNEEFVLGRIGEEGREILQQLRVRQDEASRGNFAAPGFKSAFALTRSTIKTTLLRRLLGEDGVKALAIGEFRLRGEAHQWMYDSFSLRRTLERAGFVDIRLHDAHSSDIPEWSTFHLDVTAEGHVNKPDLFFAEARKPEPAFD